MTLRQQKSFGQSQAQMSIGCLQWSGGGQKSAFLSGLVMPSPGCCCLEIRMLGLTYVVVHRLIDKSYLNSLYV